MSERGMGTLKKKQLELKCGNERNRKRNGFHLNLLRQHGEKPLKEGHRERAVPQKLDSKTGTSRSLRNNDAAGEEFAKECEREKRHHGRENKGRCRFGLWKRRTSPNFKPGTYILCRVGRPRMG